MSLQQYGFKRTKPTFFIKVKQDRIDFVHLHKFTFGPCFRVHIGSRFLCDTSDSIALNGIHSDFFRAEYNLEYGIDEDSIQRCVNDILRFVQTEGFRWFDEWADTKRLINANNRQLKI